MKSFIIGFAVLLFSGFSESCSIPQGYEAKPIAELTRLAPLVLYANVVATDNLTIHQNDYNATLNVVHVYKAKGELNETRIKVGGFADSASCRSRVEVGDEYIFFLNVNPFKARYDDISSAVAANSSETYQGILEGLCCPYTQGWFI
jgi:hypothetical protein